MTGVTDIKVANDPCWHQAKRIRPMLLSQFLCNLPTSDIYEILSAAPQGYSDASAIQHVLDLFPVPY